MAKLHKLEPIVLEALKSDPATREDNFLLYNAVLKKYIDTYMSIYYVFENHKKLGIPSLESITRCRRKLQERDPSLRSEVATEAREKEELEYVDYAMNDKVWY